MGMSRMTRRQLYDLVWSKPMRDAAREVGLSDVGLKKVCVRHEVPVPPQGYWNRVHAGQTPTATPYTELDDESPNEVIISSPYDYLPTSVRQLSREMVTNGAAVKEKIEVDHSRAPRQTEAVALTVALKKAEPNENGLVGATGPNLLRVEVAPQSIDRTVAIVDALLQAALGRGMTLRSGAKHLQLVVDEEVVELKVSEEVRWVTVPPTAQEVAQEERRRKAAKEQYREHFEWMYRPTPRPGAYQPQGKLAIEVVNKEYGVPGRWRDTATRKLENLLNRLLGDLVIYAAAVKARRQEKERRERQWKRAEDRRRLQGEREELLKEQLESFARLEQLDRYLRRLKRSIGDSDAPRSVRAYLAWCGRYADELRANCSVAGVKLALAGTRAWSDEESSDI